MILDSQYLSEVGSAYLGLAWEKNKKRLFLINLCPNFYLPMLLSLY